MVKRVMKIIQKEGFHTMDNFNIVERSEDSITGVLENTGINRVQYLFYKRVSVVEIKFDDNILQERLQMRRTKEFNKIIQETFGKEEIYLELHGRSENMTKNWVFVGRKLNRYDHVKGLYFSKMQIKDVL